MAVAVAVVVGVLVLRRERELEAREERQCGPADLLRGELLSGTERAEGEHRTHRELAAVLREGSADEAVVQELVWVVEDFGVVVQRRRVHGYHVAFPQLPALELCVRSHLPDHEDAAA